MSIKKLFESTDTERNYSSDKTQKEAFKDVESERNLQQLKDKQSEFVPQVDYSNPVTFAKYGSAYYYYKGGIEHILDYYPYDGSDAEINKFYNGLLGVEKYVFRQPIPSYKWTHQIKCKRVGRNRQLRFRLRNRGLCDLRRWIWAAFFIRVY